MLYISRHVGQSLFGVVDSDDRSEELHSVADICKFAESVHIRGVTPATQFTPKGWKYDIQPYQPPNTLTQHQGKTNMLKHTDIKVYADMIVDVTWRGEQFQDDVVIRLSEFAPVLGCGVIAHNFSLPKHGSLTLVFDNDIKSISPNAFFMSDFLTKVYQYPGLKNSLRMDTHEVSNRALLTSLSLALVSGIGGRNLVILDTEERLRKEWRRYGVGL